MHLLYHLCLFTQECQTGSESTLPGGESSGSVPEGFRFTAGVGSVLQNRRSGGLITPGQGTGERRERLALPFPGCTPG